MFSRRSMLSAYVALGLLAGCAGLSPALEEATLSYRTEAEAGRYAEALEAGDRAVQLAEERLAEDDPERATILREVADLHLQYGRAGNAGALYQRALAVQERAHGERSPELLPTLERLGQWYELEGQTGAAVDTYQRALSIAEARLGARHPDLVPVLTDLARVHRDQRRYREAEPLYRRALKIVEAAYGPDHPRVTERLDYLAGLYERMGREGDAQPLRERALTISESSAAGSSASGRSAQTEIPVDALAERYRRLGEHAKAEGLYRRAVAEAEARHGPEDPKVGRRLVDLVRLYTEQGRFEEAEASMKRALSIQEEAFGEDHVRICFDLGWLAHVYNAQGRCEAAERLHARCLSILRRGRGEAHPAVARQYGTLAVLDYCQSRYDEALEHIRRATAIYRQRPERSIGQGQLTRASTGMRDILFTQLAILQRHEPTPALVAESFEVAQLAQGMPGAAARERTGARFSVGDHRLAALVRERRRAIERWRALDTQLGEAVRASPAERDRESEAALRAELAQLDERIAELDGTIAKEFPAYHELARAEPVPLERVQALLGPDEALVSYLIGEARSYLWVVRRGEAAMHPLTMGRADLAQRVQALRQRLDPTGVTRLDELPAFPARAAHELYQVMFASADSLLQGVRHVMVVPDGALESLPFQVLVTREPAARIDSSAAYRRVEWLAKKYALTVLPTVSSLQALRRVAASEPAPEPFVGFGDPLLSGDGRGELDVAALFTRGAVADVEAVRALPALPEIAAELETVATRLGAGAQTVYTGADATETRVKSSDLSRYRVLMFSTHGLMAGDFEGLAQPALVLTPPAQATEEDDGLLTASEISALELNADWVILSACNTAAPDGTPGAEGLSGLARAFFYAGSRALLVSHWAVSSEAAVALTTGMFEALARDPDLGRARALQRAQQALIGGAREPYLAHPMFWAPFVVVGEGVRS